MVKIRKYANGIERFLHGEKGQRFFNFAYSIGAAIVIWGALFKILHLPGGSLLLCIGMGTEIAMFILTAFDRPPKEYAWEEVFPVLESHDPEDRPNMVTGQGVTTQGYASYSENEGPADSVVEQEVATSGAVHVVSEPQVVAAGAVNEGGVVVPVLPAAMAVGEMVQPTEEYFARMQELANQLAELNETTVEQMKDLNRNIAGLNTIYEIQLKSISAQLDTIDRVNCGLKDIRDMYEKSAGESARYCDETEKMTRYMRQLNAVYEKMITAMTINMGNPMMGAAVQNPFEARETQE